MCSSSSGNDNRRWHNTQDEDKDIPLWRDPHLLLDYETFWNQIGLFPPYRVPAASDEALRNMRQCVVSCTPRIYRERTEERAEEIIQALSHVIETMAEEHEYHYKMNKALYRNPPKMSPSDFDIAPEQYTELKALCMDKAKLRLAGIFC